MSLAVREYKEALRISPGDDKLKARIVVLERKLTQLKNKGGPGAKIQIPLLRFVSFHNLSIRYWDRGQAQLAIKECENAVKILNQSHLPLKGIVNMLDRMVSTHNQFKHREAKMLETESKKNMSPQNRISLTYKIGVLYFDKRMIGKAGEWLKKAEKLIRERSNIAVFTKDAEACSILNEDYIGIRDDLTYLKGMETRFCSEASCERGERGDGLMLSQQAPLPSVLSKDTILTEAGLRDSIAPQLLPEFVGRFEDDDGSSGGWWYELLSRKDIDWQV